MPAVHFTSMALVLLIGSGSAGSASVDYGINHDFVRTRDQDIPALIQAMKDADVQAVRLPIRWRVVEPERGKWELDKVDRVIRDIRAADIEVLALLMSVPAWASGVKPTQVEGFWDCYPPKKTADWAEFVRKMVGRYNSRIRTWEIWNEQNGQDFYKPMPDAEQYVEILKPAYQTVRKVDPTAAESPPSTPTNPSPAKSPTSLRSPSTTQHPEPHGYPAS